MDTYVGWKQVARELKQETGLSGINAIAEASGVSKYTLDSIFNNRTRTRQNLTGDKNRRKLDKWLKKTTDGKLSIKSFVEPSPKKKFTAPKHNEDAHKKANEHYDQVLAEAQEEQFNTGETEPESYDTPTLLRQEPKRKGTTLDEFFQSLDRYKPGLSEIAKEETDRINTLSLPHFITDDKKLRYAYLAGLERGWHEARAEHIEVLRDLLKGKIDG
jgi:transcriptional regulator with XRE-family HTH domain